MCQKCKVLEPAAMKIAEGEPHGILSAVMFFIATFVDRIRVEMESNPMFRMATEAMGNEWASRELTNIVADAFVHEHYRMIRASPEPQFAAIMDTFVMSWFMASASADAEGRDPYEWFQAKVRDRLRATHTEGDFDDFRASIEESFRQNEEMHQEARDDAAFLSSLDIDPDSYH